MDKASHPLYRELTQPHSNFGLRLIPYRCIKNFFRHSFMSTAIHMYTALHHRGCSLSQGASYHLHLYQLESRKDYRSGATFLPLDLHGSFYIPLCTGQHYFTHKQTVVMMFTSSFHFIRSLEKRCCIPAARD